MDYAHELLENLTKYYPSDIELLYARAKFQHLSQDWPSLLNTYHSIYLIDTNNTEILIKIYEMLCEFISLNV